MIFFFSSFFLTIYGEYINTNENKDKKTYGGFISTARMVKKGIKRIQENQNIIETIKKENI